MGSILIVEDDDDIRELLGEMLRRDGYQVLEATHGKHALELLETEQELPCLVLLDLMMPVMSGPELLIEIGKSQRFSSLPVVVISAGGKPEDVPEARKFIRKPPSPDLLRQTIREFCIPSARTG